MAQCPLCNSTLVDDACPICSALSPAGEPNTERDLPARPRPARPVPEPGRKSRKKEDDKASWYAAAGIERPAPTPRMQQDPAEQALAALPPTDRAEGRGDVSAAFLLLASAAGSLLALGLRSNVAGIGMSVPTIALQFAAAITLLNGSSIGRTMMSVSIAFGFVGVGTGFLISILGAIISALPLVLLLVALVAHERRIRWAAAGIGIAASLGGPLVTHLMP